MGFLLFRPPELRYKVCIPNVVLVGFSGFASQVAPYVNSSIVFVFNL